MIEFFLMTQRGYFVLERFLKEFSPNVIKQVVVAQDKTLLNDYYDEIRSLCQTHRIQCFDRKDLSSDSEIEGQNKTKNSDVSFAISWRWMIPSDRNLVVLHDSILPKYRGFAPLINSLINGEKEIGVSAIEASDQYDCGPIISQKKLSIDYPMTITKAISLIEPLYSELVNEISAMHVEGVKIKSHPQDNKKASYSLWRDEQDFYINWQESSERIKRTIDALKAPYSGARSKLNGKDIIIDDAEIFEDKQIEIRTPGKVIFINNQNPVIVCGVGLLKLTSCRFRDSNLSAIPFQSFRSRLTSHESH